MPEVGVVIAAGGRGKRFGGKVPKQFIRLNGIPMLQWSVAAFASLSNVAEIVVVAPSDEVPRVARLICSMGSSTLIAVVPGGKERQHSVWNGINSFISSPDIVLVHDAARPLVHRTLIMAVINAAMKYGSGVPGVRIVDTVKTEGHKGFYERTLDRNRLWSVQTPQGFRLELLLRAHTSARRAGFVGTDESSLVERLKVPVRIVESDPSNIKITTKEDIRLAEMVLKKRARQ